MPGPGDVAYGLPNGSIPSSGFLIYKPSNEDVVASTVLQNDNDLFFDVAANEKWLIELHLDVIGDATGNIKFGWLVPSGMAGSWHGIWQSGNSLNALSTSLFKTFADVQGLGLSGNGTIDLWVTSSVDSTAGTFQFQWAQNVASGTSTVKAGSWLLARKVT